MRSVIILICLMYTGLLPFVPLKETHLEIFLPSIYLRQVNKNFLYKFLSISLYEIVKFKHSYKVTNRWFHKYELFRRKGGPSATFLPLEKCLCRTINVLLMRPCLFNHLRSRGIHVSMNKTTNFFMFRFNPWTTGNMKWLF